MATELQILGRGAWEVNSDFSDFFTNCKRKYEDVAFFFKANNSLISVTYKIGHAFLSHEHQHTIDLILLGQF